MSAIVLGYDGTDCGKAALHAAMDAARAFGDRIVVCFGYGVAALGEAADHRNALRDRGSQLVAEATEAIGAAGLSSEVAVIDGRPADALLQTAAAHDARLIVVGTHGDHPLAGAILGAVPYQLVHQTRTPLLIVPVPR